MNCGAFCCTRRVVGAAVFAGVFAVFGAAGEQDDGYDAVIDEGAIARPEAPDDESASDSESADTAQDAGVTLGAGVSSDGGQRGDVRKNGGEVDTTPIFAKPDFELGFGLTTVDGKNWGRVALGADIPIWKFGVFLDLELFVTNKFKLSDKGWDFKNHTAEAVLRKIRYVRYGRENEPLFVKFGGLSNVTLGYGMIVDRFTNMLRYPDEKLLGLQFYLNDVFPIGLTAQTLISDFSEMGDKGGVYAARIAARPLKTSGMFLLDGLSVGGMYAVDANVYAPTKKWTNVGDTVYSKDTLGDGTRPFYLDSSRVEGLRNGKRSFGVYGFDVCLPVVRTDLLDVDIYAQSAFRADGVSGWGIGVPGVGIRLWKLTGNVEYRKIGGSFMPGHFDTYYLEERYSRGLMRSKDESLKSVSLNGIYGRIGMDVLDVLTLGGTYQYMDGTYREDGSSATNRYFEATAGFGKAIMDNVPMLSIAEAYIRNADIGAYNKYDKEGNLELGANGERKTAGSFDRSPGLYWGYRAGVELFVGLSLILDYRYGWKLEDDGKLVSDNHMNLHTAWRF